MSSSIVDVDQTGGVAVLTMNNPPLNLVTMELTARMDQLLQKLAADDGLRALVVTGSGERAFCAGSDIREFPEFFEHRLDPVKSKVEPENDMYRRLSEFPVPTVAAVNGAALGGGLELALACDLIVAEEESRLGLPELRLGVFPGSGGTFRLARRIGMGRARELIYLCDSLDARTALEWGLVNRVAPAGEALRTALDVAQRIAGSSPQALRLCKQAVSQTFLPDEADCVAGLIPLIERAFLSDDIKEGVRAFLAKEPPRF